MKKTQFLFIFFGFIFSCFGSLAIQPEKINILVLTERGGQHESFVKAAFQWLTHEKEKLNIEWTEINNTKPVNESYLKQFELIIQLDFPPYTWTQDAEKAFISYIEEGRGGWIGFHHATLLGEFDGYKMWNWFSEFMGGIRFQNYIAQLADGTVRVEDSSHPVMRGVSGNFTLRADEWYTFNKSPRPNVHVLANVDEDSYTPQTDIKMGDHPVVWVNEQKKARNVYFLMGHSNRLFESDDFKLMFANAINWAGNK
ncbi:MAG TPA: ThuA domain-containing protein [Draconibacterium sp.]|nr:ThuA domain-containing protein [Draconibacterium sp.]